MKRVIEILILKDGKVVEFSGREAGFIHQLHLSCLESLTHDILYGIMENQNKIDDTCRWDFNEEDYESVDCQDDTYFTYFSKVNIDGEVRYYEN